MLLDKKIPLIYISKQIWMDLLFILAVGTIFNYLSDAFSAHLPEMPLNVPTFLGTGISVLLSFKMSQSYDRWWEGRKIWGAIVNDSRSLVLQLQKFIPESEHDTIKQMAFRQIAWCYCLGQSLRGTNPLEHLEQYLSAQELDVIAKHHNKPLALLQLNNAALKSLKDDDYINNFTHLQLDDTLTRLCDSMGKAERINSTVFPVMYRLFLHFAIYLFVIVLSIALRDVDPIFEIPLLVLISAVFFLVEKTAFLLQDPFRNRPNDVPVTTIARTIEINIKQLLGEKEVPQPLPVNTFYIL